MKRLFILMTILLVMAGCAFTKQATTDYQTGQSTPLAAGEVSPQQKAEPIGATVSSLPIPFAGPIGAGVALIAGILFTWQRGVSIRKNNGLVPPTSSTNVSGLIQDAATVFAGMFTTASTTAPTTSGSAFQRVWKVALATIISGASIAVTQPAFASFLGSHPLISGLLVFIPSGIAGIEKALSSIQPVVTVPVAASA